MNLKRIKLFFVILICSLFNLAAEIPELKEPVMDMAQIIDEAKEQELNSALRALKESSVAQIAILTVKELESQYSSI